MKLSEYIKHNRHFDGIGMGDACLEKRAKELEDELETLRRHFRIARSVIAYLRHEAEQTHIALSRLRDERSNRTLIIGVAISLIFVCSIGIGLIGAALL